MWKYFSRIFGKSESLAYTSDALVLPNIRQNRFIDRKDEFKYSKSYGTFNGGLNGLTETKLEASELHVNEECRGWRENCAIEYQREQSDDCTLVM